MNPSSPPPLPPIKYSRGTGTFDNMPQQREADNFEAFATAVLSDRSSRKGQAYVCGPFALGAHTNAVKHAARKHWRQKHLALPRAFLPFDVDHCDSADTFNALREWVNARYKGFGYTTASHTPDKPRCRLILALSREVTREEGEQLGEAVQRLIERDLGSHKLRFDGSVYRAEQPVFTPLVGAESFTFAGEPVDANELLRDTTAPMPQAKAPYSATQRAQSMAGDDPVLAALVALGKVKSEHGNGKYAVECPLASEHTSDSNETSTVYYLPHFGGVKYGKFVCMHAHCKDRPQDDYLKALNLIPQDVWRHQTGAAMPDDTAASVALLARLPPLEYEKMRESEAQRLGVRKSVLDKAVEEERVNVGGENSQDGWFPVVEPWPEAVAGAKLLHDLNATVKRFIVCEPAVSEAAALWIAFTWCVDGAKTAPIAVITAPEKRCGKSTLLALMGKLVRKPLLASNISPAAVFRTIEACGPTLLIDEADSFMRENEELRGIINSGHTRDTAYVVRTVGDDHEPQRFSTWGAKALCGIGRLADTIMDRAIELKLRRKLQGESVHRLRDSPQADFSDLARKLARFAADNADAVSEARPCLPQALHDRAQDNWEPLLAIADLCGGDWPAKARHAALVISGEADESDSASTELLADIQAIIESGKHARISTADLLQELCLDPEKRWATLNHGRPMTARQLAARLAGYQIRPRTTRIAGVPTKGFHREDFNDAFSRYLSSPSVSPKFAVTALQVDDLSTNSSTSSVTDANNCEDSEMVSVTPNPLNSLVCYGVTAIMGVSREK